MSGSCDLAEELTQETFFRVYVNIGQLRNEDRAVPWLLRIAKNSFYAYCNRVKRVVPFEDVKPDEYQIDISEEISDKEMAKEAYDALKTLDEPYKTVFELRVFGELSLKDISDMYSKSESWARVIYYRAKQSIIRKMR